MAGDRIASIERFRAEQIARAMEPSAPTSRGRRGSDDRVTREPSAPKPKTQVSRAIDAAVGGATIAAMAYDLGHQAANAAGAIASTASNAQLGGKAGSKLAERGASGRSVTGLSNAISRAAGSNAGQVASKVVNSPVVSGLSRFALPILAGRMAWNGIEGYRKDGWKGAVLGAADAATFGLASAGTNKAINLYQAAFHSPGGDAMTLSLAKAAGHGMFSSPANAAPAAKEPRGGNARLDQEQQRQFAAADKSFAGSMARTPSEPRQDQGGSRLRGFANPAVQKAAQEARGVVNVSDWARNAEPREKRK